MAIWRALHFLAVASAGGAVIFHDLVLSAEVSREMDSTFRRRLTVLFATSLLVALASGFTWALLVAADILDQTATGALIDGGLWTVVVDTQFGTWMAIHLGFGLTLVFSRRVSVSVMRDVPLTVAFIGSLAWLGHAGSGDGTQGWFHLLADVLHLVASSAWVGSLVPFALFLISAGATKRGPTDVISVTRNFSSLGAIAVGTLLITGAVNTLLLVRSWSALVDTDYGRLVSAKVALFVIMVSIAAYNRLQLSTELHKASAVASLTRNCFLEAGLGCVVIILVGVLGTLAPAVSAHLH